MLRDYQRRTIDQLYDWFRTNTGNPCLVLPTGSGKSHIVAALCKEAVQAFPETRILMLTHVKELIKQNAQKMQEHWQDAPLGIYSAGIGKKNIAQITFAGIQSIMDKAILLGHIDLCIIDECHLVSHKDEGGYRMLINELQYINPEMRVIGLTATPYRLGHGMIDEDGALFNGIIEPVRIEELISKGYLAPLRSKVTELKLDVSKVKKRGGEYVEADLQKAVNTRKNNYGVAREIIALAGDRKAWLLFCSGVEHAYAMSFVLNEYGIKTECVTGATPKHERDQIIDDFKAGKIRALTNANVLTTGFDYPDIDLIAMLRPTMSPTLYVQMAGRGMRPKSHTDHCAVLDFAGVVQQHGPIVAVKPPKKGGDGSGKAPTKICPNCQEICLLSVKECPVCKHIFVPDEKKDKRLRLHDDDIMGLDFSPKDIAVKQWNWRKHISKSSGKEMLAVSYYGSLSDPSVTEYFTIKHEGFAGQKAVHKLASVGAKCNVDQKFFNTNDLDTMALLLNQSTPPSSIKYMQEGKFKRVIAREW